MYKKNEFIIGIISLRRLFTDEAQTMFFFNLHPVYIGAIEARLYNSVFFFRASKEFYRNGQLRFPYHIPCISSLFVQ
jgi:hypothetical protein